MQTKTGNMKKALVLVLCVSMLVTTAVPAFAAQKISNPGNFGPIDGIASDPEVGIHNSYAWCAEMFAQTDGDYLWVGMNRDMGGTLLGKAEYLGDGSLASAADLIRVIGGIPEQSTDMKGKIYRQRAADNDAPWELVYEHPAISGWRRMIVFKGDLYVCAGLTNTPVFNYSIVVRFSPDFKLGDEPEIVMWDNLPWNNETGRAKAMEHYRSAAIIDDKLYIGTFDSKIFVTDGKKLTNLTPNEGEKHSGWELFADLKLHPDFQSQPDGVFEDMTYIWDMVGFQGSLYAVVTYFGFNVFKLTPQGSGGPVITQVVGPSTDAKYPDGMGLANLVSASPYVATFDGKDYVYLGTFANGPFLAASLGQGLVRESFDEHYAPPFIFRFDADDNWEVLVGDTTGKYIAKDKTGTPLPVIGNQRAGFFTGADWRPNTSFNQYIWWMAFDDGKIYASTWDLSVMKRIAGWFIVLAFISGINRSVDGALLDALGGALGGDMDLMKIAGILGSVGKLFALNFIPISGGLVKTLFELLSVAKFLESTNPRGFDLFVSEDGRNFKPVTLSGFGNPENFGARVLLPTQYGMYVCIGNPFGGGQVWRLDDIEQELQPNIPAVVKLSVGETKKGSLRALALPAEAAVAMEGAAGNAGISLVKRSEGIIIDTEHKVTRVLNRYSETNSNKDYPTQMYDVVFTGTAVGTQDVTLRFSWNGIEAAKTVRVAVTG